MEKYLVIYKAFKDLEDNKYIYKKGDIYPREGLEPTKKRIKELSSTKNKIGKALIQKIEEEKDITNQEESKIAEIKEGEDNKIEGIEVAKDETFEEVKEENENTETEEFEEVREETEVTE